MTQTPRVVIIIPGFNTEKTIAKTLTALPAVFASDILVVDDGSRDGTAAIARAHGAAVLSHGENRGYGAAQKTGYAEALRRGADIVVMVHADFQYDPTLLPQMIAPIAAGAADACFGSRMAKKGAARAGGMAWWRFIANKALTALEEAVFRLHLTEYHTGYRAFSRRALSAIPFARNSDNYVFDTQMIAQLAVGRFRVAEIPIPTRYTEESQSPNFRKSVRYGFATLGVVVRYLLHRLGIKKFSQFCVRQ